MPEFIFIFLYIVFGAISIFRTSDYLSGVSEQPNFVFPFTFLILALSWNYIYFITPYQVANIQFCKKQQTWTETYITYQNQKNEFIKVPVGGVVPGYKVIEYQKWYVGVYSFKKDEIVPIESVEEYRQHLMPLDMPRLNLDNGIGIPIPDKQADWPFPQKATI